MHALSYDGRIDEFDAVYFIIAGEDVAICGGIKTCIKCF